jgi:glycosyltransferase involved in cell wall biosynthesis
LDNPLVSIVIPLFNKLDWIPETINSVVNQTYKNWECIIVDDGSTDGSFELVTSLTEKYPGKWRIIRQPNSGQSVARNRGIEISSGNYVALLDADDIWFADKLSRQVEFLNANKDVDLLFTSYVIFEESLTKPFRYVRFKSAEDMILRWLQMLGFGGLIESTGLVRRSFFEKQGFFDLNLSTSSGLDVSIRGLLHTKVAVLDSALVGYRLSDNQWHKKLDELSQNCFELSDRYGNNLISTKKIRRLQESYFGWNLYRGKGKGVLFKEIILCFFRVDLIGIRMLIALVLRNVKSLALGWQHRQNLEESIVMAISPGWKV